MFHSWRLSRSTLCKYLAHSSYYHHHLGSTARKVELSRQLISASHNNTHSSLSQAHSVHSVSFLSELLPMTNPEESTCVFSTPPLKPQVVSTTIASTKQKSGKKASTQSPPTKCSKSKSTSEYNLKDLRMNPIVQANTALIYEIEQLSKSEDYPPLIFFWDSKILDVFLQNMVQVVADEVEIPSQLQPAVFAGVGQGNDDSSEKVLARCILDYLQSRVQNIARLSNEHAGFAGTLIQYSNMVCKLCALNSEPWFKAVCDVGPLGGPVAQCFVTRPRSRTGIIDRIPVGGPLWS
jgi:hypothetical protein